MNKKHILITRFALPFAKENPRYTRCTNSPGWFDRRCTLFEKYTLPSVKSQTSQHFDWVLISNPNFPGIDKKRLESYGVELFWVDWLFEDEKIEGLSDFIRDKGKNSDWIITSRLDNDDMISKWFMETIFNMAREKKEWLCFPNGYMVEKDKAYIRKYSNSPFVSLVENSKEAKSVYQVSHIYSGKKVASMRKISDIPAWVQVDHGENVKNSVKRNKLKTWIPIQKIKKDFKWNENT